MGETNGVRHRLFHRVQVAAPGGPNLVGDLTWVAHGAPGVLVIHGHGSTRVNHADFCERVAAAGMNALAIDLRGHGESDGRMDAGVLDDVRAGLDLLVERGATRLGVRGSSLGGFLALLAASHPPVGAVVAICPTTGARLAAKYPEYGWAREIELGPTLRDDGVARGYWHAHGDGTVPWELSFALYQRTPQPRHLHVAMGGSHQSLQHDPSIQDETVAFLERHLTV